MGENVDNDSFNEGLKDLELTLEILNNHLKLKTFLSGYKYSLADLAVSTSLRPYFEGVIEKDLSERYKHITRWFNYCSSIGESVQVFGFAKFCEKRALKIK